MRYIWICWVNLPEKSKTMELLVREGVRKGRRNNKEKEEQVRKYRKKEIN